MKTIKKNESLSMLITQLKTLATKQDIKLWKRIATDLEKPTRNRRVVNVYKIEEYAKDGETIIVPGKVLGNGDLSRKVSVAALSFSDEARRKITEKGSIMSIEELMKSNPKGSKVRILG